MFNALLLFSFHLLLQLFFFNCLVLKPVLIICRIQTIDVYIFVLSGNLFILTYLCKECVPDSDIDGCFQRRCLYWSVSVCNILYSAIWVSIIDRFSPYWPVSFGFGQNQHVWVYVFPYQHQISDLISVSVFLLVHSISQYQPLSIDFGQYGPALISNRQYRSISVGTSQYWSISICVGQY